MYQKGKIVESVRLSNRVKKLVVKPENPFNWVCGQFIVTKSIFDGIEKIADYTIVSSPTNTNLFEILVDNYEGSQVGALLHSLEVNGEFIFKAPHGRYMIHGNGHSIVFISKDIGLAANISLMQELSNKGYSKKAILFNFQSNDFEEFGMEYINQLSTGMKFEYFLITGNDYPEIEWANGKLKKQLLEELFSKHKDSHFYIAGKSEFVKNLRIRLIKLGVDKNKITREFFG